MTDTSVEQKCRDLLEALSGHFPLADIVDPQALSSGDLCPMANLLSDYLGAESARLRTALAERDERIKKLEGAIDHLCEESGYYNEPQQWANMKPAPPGTETRDE